MKILSLHCDYITFKPLKKALKSIGKLVNGAEKEKRVDEALTIFTAVEKKDESNKNLLKHFISNIEDIANKVNAKNIVLYPYAHLSPSLASPEFAQDILEKAEKALSKKFKTTRAPFGYYKEFELKCKGHPLAELSREIHHEGTEEKDEKVIEPNETYDCSKLLNQVCKVHLDKRKLKENDHRILGEKLDLFSFFDCAPGMVFWHNKGWIIYNQLIEFWREEHKKSGYEEISTPQIMDKKLWQISGHWDKYKENVFLTKYEDREFVIKPMNCPGGILIFKEKPKSYKELPLRVGELGTVYRQELSGVLGGLFRVLKFTQDDAHIYCEEKQLEEEIIKIIDLIDRFYKKFNFAYHIELSTRPEKRIGSDKLWDKAEKVLESVLNKKKTKFKLNKGDGAFYGPKIDFHIQDSLGRTWQTATIQLDFAMPERFDLTYTDKDNKKNRPVMLHRTVYGSLERFIGILLEHTSGNLPTWLSPIQCRVLSFTDRNISASEKILEQLKEQGIRADSDFDSSRINEKVRNAELQKIPYIIVIGDKEEQNQTLAIRHRGEKLKFGVKYDEFISELKKEIKERK